MLEQTEFVIDDGRATDLVERHPWATIISPPFDPSGDLVVSHLPVLQEPGARSPVILGHLAAADAKLHQLGEHRVTIVVQGPHGYISPTWYQAGPFVPTWNFAVVHLHGVPDILDAETTYDILDATCARMERVRTPAWQLESVRGYADRIAPYTTGFRLVPDRIVAKAKMSQDKSSEVVERVISALRTDPFHADPVLADAMTASHPRISSAAGPS
jgi:transcriptional regulator